MTFSKIIAHFAVTLLFLTTFTGLASAASKITEPDGTVKRELSKALPLSIPGVQKMSEAKLNTIKLARNRSRSRRHGRRLIGGLLALGAAAVIAHEMRRSNRRYYNSNRRYYNYDNNYNDRRANRCDRLLRRCNRGNNRACRKFDNRCDY